MAKARVTIEIDGAVRVLEGVITSFSEQIDTMQISDLREGTRNVRTGTGDATISIRYDNGEQDHTHNKTHLGA